jgi:hypothetical protein
MTLSTATIGLKNSCNAMCAIPPKGFWETLLSSAVASTLEEVKTSWANVTKGWSRKLVCNACIELSAISWLSTHRFRPVVFHCGMLAAELVHQGLPGQAPSSWLHLELLLRKEG